MGVLLIVVEASDGATASWHIGGDFATKLLVMIILHCYYRLCTLRNPLTVYGRTYLDTGPPMRACENFGRTSAPRLQQAEQTKPGLMSDSRT